MSYSKIFLICHERRWGLTVPRRAVFKGRFQGHTGRPSRLSRRAISDGARGGPSDPGPLGNRGNRAPDRLVPVTAPSNMRRSLTCPSPDGPSPPVRDRPRPCRAAGGRGREGRAARGRAVPAQVMAARTVPTPGGPGAGEPGDPPLAADAERRRTRQQGTRPAPRRRVITRRWCPARSGMPSARPSSAIGPG